MDFDYAHGVLTGALEAGKDKENSSPSREAFRKRLAESLGINRTRILAFTNKPPAPKQTPSDDDWASFQQSKPVKPITRCIPQTSERTLDAPDLQDDFYLNLLDWGANNVVAIALANTVYLWDATNSTASELVTIDHHMGPVTSVKWAPDGRHISLGLFNSEVQLWDSSVNKLVLVFLS